MHVKPFEFVFNNNVAKSSNYTSTSSPKSSSVFTAMNTNSQ